MTAFEKPQQLSARLTWVEGGTSAHGPGVKARFPPSAVLRMVKLIGFGPWLSVSAWCDIRLNGGTDGCHRASGP